MVPVTRSGPASLAIELRVGDGDASVRLIPGYQVHSPNERYGDMIDPNLTAAVERDGVSTPDILWIEFSDLYVLRRISPNLSRSRRD